MYSGDIQLPSRGRGSPHQGSGRASRRDTDEPPRAPPDVGRPLGYRLGGRRALVARRTSLAGSVLATLTPRAGRARPHGPRQDHAAIADTLLLSQSAIEKHVNAIFIKLGLTEEAEIHRRVAAVLTLLRDGGLTRRPKCPDRR